MAQANRLTSTDRALCCKEQSTNSTQPPRLVQPRCLRPPGHGPLRKGKLPAHHSARCHCGLTAISTYASRAVVVRGPGSDRKRVSKREARLTLGPSPQARSSITRHNFTHAYSRASSGGTRAPVFISQSHPQGGDRLKYFTLCTLH